MQKKSILILFLVMLSFNIVSAQPPFQQFSGDNGITIETSIIEVHKVDQDFFFNIHAHNSSNGLLLTNETTNCTAHIFRPSNGSHIFRGPMAFDSNRIDFEAVISSGNFTELGQYWALFNCEVPGVIGGFFSYGFDVSPSGSLVDTGEFFMYIWIMIILLVLGMLGIYLSTIIPYKNIEEETKDGKIIRAITFTKYMKLITIWITSGIILMFLTVLTGVINNYVQFIEMKTLFTNTYIFLRIIGSGLSIGIMILLFVNFYKDLLWNKSIREYGKAFVEKNARDSR